MKDLEINILVLDNKKNIINKINEYINKINIKINVHFKNNYDEALTIIKANNIDYFFISGDIVNSDQIELLTEVLKKSEHNDCVIIFQNIAKEFSKGICNGNFIISDELTFNLFKKLIGYLIVSKNKNVVTDKDFSEIYNNNFVSTHDALTMLPNRIYLLDKIDSIIKEAGIQKNNFALFFLDLDGFKDINDTAGHEAGDLVLKEVAKRLIRYTRATDTVSRHGGDEFIILLPTIRSKSDVQVVADKILSVLAEPFQIHSENWNITASIGVAIYPDDGLTPQKLISNADTAMYTAKQSGKNTVRYFNKELDAKIAHKVNIQEEVRKAILNDDFEILLQPQHDLATNDIIGAEAFIRWHHKDKGLIMPNDFLPYIANTGYINSLGNLILQKCLALNYQMKLNKNIKIAINIEARQLVSDIFINKITGLKKFGVNIKQLAIEITEDCFKTNFKIVKQRLETLRSLGVRIHLDDFGLGTSSITHLAELPIDIIKIDNKSLCDGSNSRAMKMGIIVLSHSFGIKTMAKRIDNNDQLFNLKSLGCDYGQGYCYSKPLSVNEFQDYLVKNSFTHNRT